MMSNRQINEFREVERQSVLIVTDEPVFSSQLSELLLRAGVTSLVFASSAQAIKQVHHAVPSLILLHVSNSYLGEGMACYQQLQSDAVSSSIPTLFYTPAVVMAEREVGAAPSNSTAFTESDVLVAQFVGSIVLARQMIEPEDDILQTLPHGRADL